MFLITFLEVRAPRPFAWLLVDDDGRQAERALWTEYIKGPDVGALFSVPVEFVLITTEQDVRPSPLAAPSGSASTSVAPALHSQPSPARGSEQWIHHFQSIFNLTDLTSPSAPTSSTSTQSPPIAAAASAFADDFRMADHYSHDGEYINCMWEKCQAHNLMVLATGSTARCFGRYKCDRGLDAAPPGIVRRAKEHVLKRHIRQ